MNTGRDSPLIIPTMKDEIVVMGGRNNRTSEKRLWCETVQDYDFRGCFINDEELVNDSANY